MEDFGYDSADGDQLLTIVYNLNCENGRLLLLLISSQTLGYATGHIAGFVEDSSYSGKSGVERTAEFGFTGRKYTVCWRGGHLMITS